MNRIVIFCIIIPLLSQLCACAPTANKRKTEIFSNNDAERIQALLEAPNISDEDYEIIVDICFSAAGLESVSQEQRDDYKKFLKKTVVCIDPTAESVENGTIQERIEEYDKRKEIELAERWFKAKKLESSAKSYVTQFLQLLDDKKYQDAYALLSPSMKKDISKNDWANFMKNDRYINDKREDNNISVVILPNYYNKNVFNAEIVKCCRMQSGSAIKFSIVMEYRKDQWNIENYGHSIVDNCEEEQ